MKYLIVFLLLISLQGCGFYINTIYLYSPDDEQVITLEPIKELLIQYTPRTIFNFNTHQIDQQREIIPTTTPLPSISCYSTMVLVDIKDLPQIRCDANECTFIEAQNALINYTKELKIYAEQLKREIELFNQRFRNSGICNF